MKSKFGSFDFGSVEVLSRAEEAKVKGGAYGSSGSGGGGASTCSAYCVTGSSWFSSGTSTYMYQTSGGSCADCTGYLQMRCSGRLEPGPCRAA